MSTYFAELDRRFPGGFAPGDTLVADAPAFRAPGGAFLIAIIHDETVGCGGVLTLRQGLGEIKRMWIADGWRGVGLGRRLLAELEQVGAQLGHREVHLDTNDTLTEAIAMYQSAGYRSIQRYNDNPFARRWFAKELPR
jgi:GNAT superfamily N-acetyltransferase